MGSLAVPPIESVGGYIRSISGSRYFRSILSWGRLICTRLEQGVDRGVLMGTRIACPVVDFPAPTSHPASCRPLFTPVPAIICKFFSAVVGSTAIGWASICTLASECAFLFDPSFLRCNLALHISFASPSTSSLWTYSSGLVPDDLFPLLPNPLFLLMLMSLPFLSFTLLFLSSEFLVRL